jgi:hypothetical protein
MTTRRTSEIVPACGLVATVALLQPRPLTPCHVPHHHEAALHKMTGRGPMALRTLPSARRRMNVRLDEPALRTVAGGAVLAEVTGVNIVNPVARTTIEQSLFG